ncbi:MAG: glycosyltransferase family 2 protein [Bryobacteraceae bacterium]|nr:glycosyltransferase family 2 protein [Bryobacteraceae bacterium]
MPNLRSAYHFLQGEWLRATRLWAWPTHRREIEERMDVVREESSTEKGPDRLVVVCLVRDGADHVETFVDHHLRLGASHIVLFDNGSSDGTVERAKRLSRVTTLRCELPYKSHSYAYKRLLVERWGDGCWCLLADIDERFEYPGADRLPLEGFLRYMNERRYTAVLAQMLDLFPDGPPSTWPGGGADLIESSVWYDLSKAYKSRPWRPMRANRFADPEMVLYRGGIRRMAFGASPVLSKFAMLCRAVADAPVLESAHFCRGARVADVSGVLLHYKYERAFRERCVEAVMRGNFYSKSGAYKVYLDALDRNPELRLKGPTARRLGHVNELVDAGFLRASRTYWEHVGREADAARAAQAGRTKEAT